MRRCDLLCFESKSSLPWRHNDHDGVSNHQPCGCLLNCLFRRRSKKTPKLRGNGLCVGNSPGPVNSPHKGPATRKMLPFDDVIMIPNHDIQVVSGSIINSLMKATTPIIAMLYIDISSVSTRIHGTIVTHVSDIVFPRWKMSWTQYFAPTQYMAKTHL